MVLPPSKLFGVKNKWKCNPGSCTLLQTSGRLASYHQAHNSICAPQVYWSCRLLTLCQTNVACLESDLNVKTNSPVEWDDLEFLDSIITVHLFSLRVEYRRWCRIGVWLFSRVSPSKSDLIFSKNMCSWVMKNVCCTNRWINNRRAVCVCVCIGVSYLCRVEAGSSIDVLSQACR